MISCLISYLNLQMVDLPAQVVDIISMIPISYSANAADRIIKSATPNSNTTRKMS